MRASKIKVCGNRRLLSADANGVAFKYKDYRIEGPARYKTMTLATDEFIRRFLIHVLPKGFHRSDTMGYSPAPTEPKILKCAHTIIAYNSCRNRHCPKCQGAAAREWLAERETDLLPVPAAVAERSATDRLALCIRRGKARV